MQATTAIALAASAALILIVALTTIFSNRKTPRTRAIISENIGGERPPKKGKAYESEENESRASRDRSALDTIISSLFLCGDILFEDGDDPKLVVNNADGTEISLTKAGARALREAGIPTREELEKEDEGDGIRDSLNGIISCLSTFLRHEEGKGTMAEETEQKECAEGKADAEEAATAPNDMRHERERPGGREEGEGRKEGPGDGASGKEGELPDPK